MAAAGSQKPQCSRMSDFRLEVFYTVARKGSFTKAAQELYISQPAVSRHIQELESQYGCTLFEREGNQIRLSPAGALLMEHAEKIFTLYRQAAFELDALSQRKSGQLKLGASTTLSQYVLPPVLAGFRQCFPAIRCSLVTANTEAIEQALLAKEIHLGLIEGRSRHPRIRYSTCGEDEIMLVAGPGYPGEIPARLSPEALRELPLVLREPGSGTLEVIEHALLPLNLRLQDLHIDMQLGSTEAIKSYLSHAACMAFISRHAVREELHTGRLRVVEVPDLRILRQFYLIQLQGRPDGLSELFIRYLRLGHNLK